MPLIRFVADVVGVVTICLVALLILFGLICIVNLIYLRYRINNQGFTQLKYFTGPWIIRTVFVMFAVCWGLGEIVRLDLLRQKGRVLSTIGSFWQEALCKCYIMSNIGFAEPCLYMTLAFLLRAPLQKLESGPLGQRWNGMALRNVLLWCMPVLFLQIIAIFAGPELNNYKNGSYLLSDRFTRSVTIYALDSDDPIALCRFPLLSTIVFGMYGTVLTIYLMCIGKQNLNLVISRVLRRRVYIILLLVAVCLPLRSILLGLTALWEPKSYQFQALAFLAFIAPLCCVVMCMSILVYCPVVDSLALGSLQDLEARRRVYDDPNDSLSLIANQSHVEESSRNSPCRISGASTKTESISFRADDRSGTFVELSLFSPSRDGSPQFQGWPMRPIQPLQPPSAL